MNNNFLNHLETIRGKKELITSMKEQINSDRENILSQMKHLSESFKKIVFVNEMLKKANYRINSVERKRDTIAKCEESFDSLQKAEAYFAIGIRELERYSEERDNPKKFYGNGIKSTSISVNGLLKLMSLNRFSDVDRIIRDFLEEGCDFLTYLEYTDFIEEISMLSISELENFKISIPKGIAFIPVPAPILGCDIEWQDYDNEEVV